MYVLAEQWEDGYLDYHRDDGELRIQVRFWCPIRTLRDVYVEQPRSLRRVLNYVREVGVISVVRKIRSRMAERVRNARVLAIGAGIVVEGDGVGNAVVFIAPCHPRSVERIVLRPEWTANAGSDLAERVRNAKGVSTVELRDPDRDSAFEGLEGYNEFSGRRAPVQLRDALDRAKALLATAAPDSLQTISTVADSAICEQRSVGSPAHSSTGSLRAAIFGLGHYAKTCIVPFVPKGIDIASIHEIDPTQIGRQPAIAAEYDTCPTLRASERYDIVFAAGYHHTHAPLAVEVLEAGGAAVIEKPMATTQAQLDSLMAAIGAGTGRAYAGFHMRYSPLWRMAREDLNVPEGEPIHYDCIVFEIPLGRLHWYNWPSSGSRLISNGCHWFDHFLFMNRYSKPMRYHAWRGGNNDLHCSVELENGAVMSMVLTDHGSTRIGVQDHVQLRANGVTVRVDHNSRYFSEDGLRIIRRRRFNRSRLYGMMYSEICRRILAGEPGDDPESIRVTTQLMLDLEQQLVDKAASTRALPRGAAATVA
ncbi:MAG: Gfo/Idh/MocA family oxidoreductase [Phycisphaerales bacterium]|nr:Gfo/Idh/MocA family oxidoreductase [Phycisphaerales bacterium]MCB9854178.1 Gfo/Idh/MocA family oxidoreductase [Phycisphaerales bacterium]MCB9864686.1 Gfo/Idh/MocA family oxidoreductase [Phycisphaerales bacterium]